MDRIDQKLPPGAAGAGGRLTVTGHASPGLDAPDWWARLELRDEARGQVVRAVFLGPARRAAGGMRRSTLVHVPAESRDLRIDLFGAPSATSRVAVRVLSRAAAAASLLGLGAELIPACLTGTWLGAPGRIRATLGQAPARRGESPPYAWWITRFESLPAPPAPPLDMQIAIGAGPPDAIARSLASARAVAGACRDPLVISASADWARAAAEWVIVLGAGETIAAGALAWFAACHQARPDAAGMTADADHVTAQGSRHTPVFKPASDTLLLASGFVTAGACAFRWHGAQAELPADGASARFTLARTASPLAHIPRILSHLPPNAPPVAEPVHVARAASFTPTVCALIPTAARSSHVVWCVQQVLSRTDYPRLQVLAALSAPRAAKPRVLARLGALQRLTLVDVSMPVFNFAAVLNRAAAHANADFLLLLNDDVVPKKPDWLDCMLALMQDPAIGIVGARLFYGNGMVQHEGVALGLAGLCEHLGRLRPGADTGPNGIALLNRQVSAVTAACLLIRTELYRSLGGMDEGFAIALNDVDLCLRARAAGYGVAYCADAELYHYESLSLGRHYAGDRQKLESLEVRRLRERWHGTLDADPFYSPAAATEPGREWQPGFAMRQAAIPVWPP
jgi:hypothetical protein